MDYVIIEHFPNVNVTRQRVATYAAARAYQETMLANRLSTIVPVAKY